MDGEQMVVDAVPDGGNPSPAAPALTAEASGTVAVNSDQMDDDLEAATTNEIIKSPPQAPTQLAELQDNPSPSSPRPSFPTAMSSSSPAPDGSNNRQLNVTDALSYLDAVKVQFTDQPDVYNHFLDIMKEFKSQAIDTPGVIKRVSALFSGHPSLIQGFNTFLPAGYMIECSDDQDTLITVTTPSGVMHTIAGDDRAWQHGIISRGPMQPGPSDLLLRPATPPGSFLPPQHPMHADQPAYQEGTMVPALEYVQKIKQRCEPDVYRQFLDILSQYHQSNMKEDEVTRRISLLFADAPDLRSEFSVFLSDRGNLDEPSMVEDTRSSKRKVVDNAPVASKRKRRSEREKEREQRERDLERERRRDRDLGTSTRSKGKRAAHPEPVRPLQAIPPQSEDRQFFDRVKRVLDNRDVYNEFLKIINLFTQGYIDTARLVHESRNFLGESDLMAQWCQILEWDAVKDAENWSIERQKVHGYTRPMVVGSINRPTHKDLHNEFGSYRKLPAHEVNVTCSGRDEMCKSVLNDEWVSHPTWTTDDAGFGGYKKNVYEEALHRSEEERHEYDFHIDAIVRTIGVLEPINNKMAMLPPEERAQFKLKANICGPIHQRVIKKIYGRDCGGEVVGAIQDNPTVAVPLVLARLKQKEAEWRKAQREWDKVWREVDARNYVKSLDHQGVAFKAEDRRAVSGKAFIHQIETARAEQTTKRASLLDPLYARTRPRHQMEFEIADFDVLKDVLKLVFSFMDRTSMQVNDKRRVESFLRSFIPLFLGIDVVEFNKAFSAVQEAVDSDASDMDVGEDAEVSSVTSKASRGRKSTGGGDLRKKLLKSEQAKSASNRKTRAQGLSSRFASPVVPVEEEVNGAMGSSGTAAGSNSGTSTKRSGKMPFYTNANFYVLMRQIQVLYSRLLLFKSLVKDDASDPTTGVTSGDPDRDVTSKANLYEFMLATCERLFDNEIEQNMFEDQMRYMFGVKEAYKIFTVDKVIGFIIKQVQVIIADNHSQELLEALKKERAVPTSTFQDQLNSRHNAERILGPDENLFRIDWVPESSMVTIQLIGKDDFSFEDPEVVSGRWQAYIDTLTSDDTSEKAPYTGFRRPFLSRNRRQAESAVPDVLSSEKLQIKVCVRTYRFFFVPNTEDSFWRLRKADEVKVAQEQVRARDSQRRKWLETVNKPDAAVTGIASSTTSSDSRAPGPAAASAIPREQFS